MSFARRVDRQRSTAASVREKTQISHCDIYPSRKNACIYVSRDRSRRALSALQQNRTDSSSLPPSFALFSVEMCSALQQRRRTFIKNIAAVAWTQTEKTSRKQNTYMSTFSASGLVLLHFSVKLFSKYLYLIINYVRLKKKKNVEACSHFGCTCPSCTCLVSYF